MIIGEEIKNMVRKRGLNAEKFAELLETDLYKVYDIYKRTSISTDLLWKISEALNFNFFSLFFPQVVAEHPVFGSCIDEAESIITASFTLEYPLTYSKSVRAFHAQVNALAERNGGRVVVKK